MIQTRVKEDNNEWSDVKMRNLWFVCMGSARDILKLETKNDKVTHVTPLINDMM